MENSLDRRFLEHVRVEFPEFFSGGRFLLAFSGGVDSTVLGYLLKKTKVPFVAAHCNFHLRGEESLRDERFAVRQAERWGVELLRESFDTREYALREKCSVEMAARDLRYGWFARLVREFRLAGVITAHHGDDQVETVLLNFTRGSSWEGLAGMRPRHGMILRPMLPFSREEIERFARQNGWEWVEDSTNASTDYVRNLLRIEVIPHLKRINPSLVHSVGENTAYLQQAAGLYAHLVQEKTALMVSRRGSRDRISIPALRSLGREAGAALYEILKGYGLESRTGDVMRSVVRGHSGAVFAGVDFRLLRDRDFLLIERTGASELEDDVFDIEAGVQRVDFPLRLHLEWSERTAGETFDRGTLTACFDADRLAFPLRLRRPRPGDTILPLGMGGRKKKVSKLFKDCKLSLFDKRDAWLLCSADGQVAWAVGLRSNEAFRVSDDTRRVLTVRWEPLG